MESEKNFFHISNANKGEYFFDAYYAVEDDGWARRFVEKKQDNLLCFADTIMESGGTFLPEASIYPINEIEGSGFKVEEITREEFDRVWTKAVDSCPEVLNADYISVRWFNAPIVSPIEFFEIKDQKMYRRMKGFADTTDEVIFQTDNLEFFYTCLPSIEKTTLISTTNHLKSFVPETFKQLTRNPIFELDKSFETKTITKEYFNKTWKQAIKSTSSNI